MSGFEDLSDEALISEIAGLEARWTRLNAAGPDTSHIDDGAHWLRSRVTLLGQLENLRAEAVRRADAYMASASSQQAA